MTREDEIRQQVYRAAAAGQLSLDDVLEDKVELLLELEVALGELARVRRDRQQTRSIPRWSGDHATRRTLEMPPDGLHDGRRWSSEHANFWVAGGQPNDRDR